MAENKKSVLLYCDLIHTVEKLNDVNAGLLFKHILRYVNDKNPEAPNDLIDLVFEPIKQQLKRDLKSWEKTLVKKREGGKKGMEKRWGKKITPDNIVIKNITPITDTVTVTVTDNVKVKDNVKYNFRVCLLNFGFKENLVDDWLVIRKNKKASNTETAFNGFVKQIELTGIDKNEALRICVEKSWAGLKAEWIQKETKQESKIETFLKNIEIARQA